MPKATVCECDDSVFSGDITVSSGCIIHPRVNIIAKSGPIIIGENCLIEEYTTIIHDTGEENPTGKPPVLVIGANNVFEVGCHVEALKIGEKNVFECKSYVSSGVKVTNNCTIGAGCKLKGEQTLTENTIIHGKSCAEREAIEKSGVSDSLIFIQFFRRQKKDLLGSFYFQSHSLQLVFLRYEPINN